MTAEQTNAKPDNGNAAGRLTILLADDEAGVREFAGEILRSRGYRVLEAADGADALEIAEQHAGPIHLLLTDWSMPRLNGGALIHRLSTGRPETAVLVMSGNADVVAPAKSRFLRKPFSYHDLVTAVCAALPSGANGY